MKRRLEEQPEMVYQKKPDKRLKKKAKKKGLCFGWAKGECLRGDKCIFSHDEAAKGKGIPVTSYGAPWPDTRDPFGDVVARNYTELVLSRTLSSDTSTSSTSSTSATTSTISPASKPTCCLNQYVHYHPNHLCIVGIAANHAALTNGAAIKKISFRSVGGVNITEMKMSGKKKAGSLKVKKNTVLCDIILENGQSFAVISGIEGNLIEANKRIIENPALLSQDPRYRGYIAIVFQPKDNKLRRDLAECTAISSE